MLKELQESYIYKFDSPMTAYLYYRVNEGWCDEETGSVEWHGWYARIGKRLVWEDDRGFVGSRRYLTVQDAMEDFASLNAEYSEWSADDDD